MMQKIAAVKRIGKKDFEIVLLDRADILHVCMNGKTISYHTRDGEYDQMTTLEEIDRYFAEYDPQFQRVERGYIANLDAAVCYDTQRYVLCYGDNVKVETPVTRTHERLVKDAEIPFITKKEKPTYFPWL